MVKEGYWYGLPLVLAGGGLMGVGVYWAGASLLVLAALTLNFFRDPDRRVPSDSQLLVSPADGRVVQIAEESFESRPMRRVSIFMSPLDVHVNRSPIAGTICSVTYIKGTFGIASNELASVQNEQNVFTISGEQGFVVVKQIAGAVARRIVFWKHKGDVLGRGERVGLIKFGSRVDVFVDESVKLCVKRGDRVRAGSSVIGISKPQE
jgi:phosphatidylserine decarboxylase